jgi:hypothetical protein
MNTAQGATEGRRGVFMGHLSEGPDKPFLEEYVTHVEYLSRQQEKAVA